MPTTVKKSQKGLVTNKTPKKQFTRFRPRVRSRHPSHNPLRTQLPLLPFRSIIRLGSTTIKDTDSQKNFVLCNSVDAIRNSSSKLLMKRCFAASGVKSALYYTLQDFLSPTLDRSKLFPCVIKSHMGSRGRGNYLINSQEELNSWLTGHANHSNYIVEKFHDYSREYRLHVTKDGCFYTCRKMLKNETPDDKRWYRNDSNSVWIVENNPQFDKPSNWDTIVAECVKALNAVGLDVGACDVKVQSAKDKKGRVRPTPDFIVIEINSAPSFGEGTLQRYLEVIPQILKDKKK